jgi:hypothetical protein
MQDFKVQFHRFFCAGKPWFGPLIFKRIAELNGPLERQNCESADMLKRVLLLWNSGISKGLNNMNGMPGALYGGRYEG